MFELEKFIYVFDEKAKRKLEETGFSLIKENKKKDVYVFMNRADLIFTDRDFQFVTSDTLTF